MAETRYRYAKAAYREERLLAEIQAGGLAALAVYGAGSNVEVSFADPITPAQAATLGGLVAAHDATPTPDERTERLRVPLVLVAALAKAIEAAWTVNPGLKTATPAWARAAIAQAIARIDAARA